MPVINLLPSLITATAVGVPIPNEGKIFFFMYTAIRVQKGFFPLEILTNMNKTVVYIEVENVKSK